MKRHLLLSLAATLSLGALAASTSSCSDTGFGDARGRRRLIVELLPPSNPGTRDQTLPLIIGKPIPFTIRVRALLPDGTPDTAFSTYVRISAKPGAIAPIAAADANGRNLLLKNGVSEPTEVLLSSAYGTTHILADDLGYIPTDPMRDPPPQCSDGIDNDGDGRVDFPADDGCAFANDDAELGGTFEQGASPPIFFPLPRVADVRGVTCDPTLGCSGTGETPYPKDQVAIDTGFRQSADGSQAFAFDVVVVRVSSNGFFFTDVTDNRAGFTSLYAFNFNAPPRMRVCDRLKSVTGTASEFFGLTQISYPTWSLEEWDPSKRPCLVPDPYSLRPTEVRDTSSLLKQSAGLVRVETTPDRRTIARVSGKLGEKDVPKQGALYLPAADATNCDYNRDGRIDFAPGNPEGECSTACTADVDCIEYSNFKGRSTFRLVVEDANKQQAAIQADASADPSFIVQDNLGKELRSYSGTLIYFSGGSQFTIEARCADDIVIPLDAQVPPPDRACVLPRTPLELNPQ